jgi:hypothetical protein
MESGEVGNDMRLKCLVQRLSSEEGPTTYQHLQSRLRCHVDSQRERARSDLLHKVR